MTKTKKFNKEWLQDNLWNSKVVVHEEVTDKRRWVEVVGIVFRADDNLYYSTCYERGLTEYQEVTPFEHDPEEIECVQVHQVEVVTRQWRPVE